MYNLKRNLMCRILKTFIEFKNCTIYCYFSVISKFVFADYKKNFNGQVFFLQPPTYSNEGWNIYL